MEKNVPLFLLTMYVMCCVFVVYSHLHRNVREIVTNLNIDIYMSAFQRYDPISLLKFSWFQCYE